MLNLKRHEYSRPPLSKESLLRDPIEQFRDWFEEAERSEMPLPEAMTLATADASGSVSSRTVLMKGFDARGFIFFTHYGSRKSRQIGENPRVSLLFPWLKLERQVEILGTAERISTAESVAYFLTRPFDSQIAAWISEQSKVIVSREFLMQKFRNLRQRFGGHPVPKPQSWGGYRIVPWSIEFWQGGANRLNDRFRYTRDETGGWRLDRLSP